MSGDFERQPSPPPIATLPILVGTLEAARLLGIGRTLLYEVVNSGDVPSTRIGHRRLFRVSDLRDYVDALPNVYADEDEQGTRRIIRRIRRNPRGPRR